MKMNLRRQNFGQNVSRTFKKVVYLEKMVSEASDSTSHYELCDRTTAIGGNITPFD